ncbi:MAG: hypothetical protein R6U13_15710 [Desulfatiglandaceae bacterium]
MKKRRSVVFWGNSLVMSAMERSLHEHPGFQIQQINHERIGIGDAPCAAQPDVIVFDMTTMPEHFAVSALQACPMLLLIGIDIENHKMLVLSGRELRFLTADDLVQAIDQSFPAEHAIA